MIIFEPLEKNIFNIIELKIRCLEKTLKRVSIITVIESKCYKLGKYQIHTTALRLTVLVMTHELGIQRTMRKRSLAEHGNIIRTGITCKKIPL